MCKIINYNIPFYPSFNLTNINILLTKDLFIARLTSSDPLPYICWKRAFIAASPSGCSAASCFSISFSTLSQSLCTLQELGYLDVCWLAWSIS